MTISHAPVGGSLSTSSAGVVVDWTDVTRIPVPDGEGFRRVLEWMETAPEGQNLRVLLPSSVHSPLARSVQGRLQKRGIRVTQRRGYLTK